MLRNNSDLRISGNFYRKLPGRFLLNYVVMLVYDRKSPIKSISMSRDTKLNISVNLQFVWTTGDNLFYLCQRSFPNDLITNHRMPDEKNPRGNNCSVEITSETIFKKLIELLKSLNSEFTCKDTTQKLIEELSRMWAYVLGDTSINQQHSIPELKVDLDNAPKSSELMIADPKATRKSLSRGGNPNQTHLEGGTRLFYAAQRNAKDTIKFLLAYNADPWARGEGIYFESALERAMKLNNSDLYNYMMNWGVHPQKALTSKSSKQLMQVSKFDVTFKDDQVETTYYLSDNSKYTTKLGKTNDSSKEKEVFELYSKYFCPSTFLRKEPDESPENAWMKFYAHELEGHYKFTDRIFFEGRFIGENLYEFIFIKSLPQVIFFHLSCTYVNENFRGKGLSDPLMYNIVYAMQKLFSNKIMVEIYQSISYGSAALSIKDLTCFPKFVNEQMVSFAKVLAPKIMRNPKSDEEEAVMICDEENDIYYSDLEVGMKQAEVKAGANNEFENPHDFLYNGRRGFDKQSQLIAGSHRAVPFILPIGAETFDKHDENAEHMNIDLNLLTDSIANCFKQLIPELKPELDKNANLYNCHQFFWRGEMIKTKKFSEAREIRKQNVGSIRQ